MFKHCLISIIFIAFWWNASASVYLNLYSKYYVASNQNLYIADRKMYGQKLRSDSNLNSRNLRISNKVYKNDRLFVTDDYAMEYFPSNLAQVFPSLEWLSVRNSRLREVHRNEIYELKNLIILSLANNFLEYIEAELFTGNLNLQLIDLANNRINFVDPTAFEGLLSLKFLHLHENKCTSIKLKSQILNFEAKVNRYNGTCWTDLENIKPKIETLKHNQDMLNIKFYNVSVILKNTTKPITMIKKNNSYGASSLDKVLIFLGPCIALIIFGIVISILNMLHIKRIRKSFENIITNVKNANLKDSSGIRNSSVDLNDYEEPLNHEENIYEKVDYSKVTNPEILVISN